MSTVKSATIQYVLLVSCFLTVVILFVGCGYTYPKKVTITQTPTVDGMGMDGNAGHDEKIELPDITERVNAVFPSDADLMQEEQEQQPLPTPIEQPDETGLTESQKEEVVNAANHRLDTGWYTKQSMINGLMEDGFSKEEAEYGATHCYVEL